MPAFILQGHDIIELGRVTSFVQIPLSLSHQARSTTTYVLCSVLHYRHGINLLIFVLKYFLEELRSQEREAPTLDRFPITRRSTK